MNRRLKGLLCFAFAANALWLFPRADEPRYEYRAVELNESNAHRYIAAHPSVRPSVLLRGVSHLRSRDASEKRPYRTRR
ncbi:hypothetical protein [Haladaptatus salinisoli]|uniref:hypothetical protein n=1 Tax=Haladaptatus salinisoli TaxID=2884876 RepID=UPI001D0A1BAD|nr:hypothetical protein [Haladaptatus salinisoli]